LTIDGLVYHFLFFDRLDIFFMKSIIPAREARSEILVSNSHFIATLAPVFSVEEARAYIARIRSEFSDASHNVPAFIIGHGASVITHCSDDGEPSGTAGRPALAVLTGSGLGYVAVVVTRYFGGTKLGTGGLVRAYGDAVRSVLDVTVRAEKITVHTVMIVLPYPMFERTRILISTYRGEILDEAFGTDVTMAARFTVEDYPQFQSALIDGSRGTIQPEIIETSEVIVPINS
jgi:uncharacterized YigZ family protein